MRLQIASRSQRIGIHAGVPRTSWENVLIEDSVPWKEELLRIAETLDRRTTQRRWTERTSFLVERDVMNAAYAIRKLNEARKISDELAQERVTVERHQLLGKPVDIWNRFEFYKHYDMERSDTVQLTLAEFCNQIIHSWVWMISVTDDPSPRFNGIYVSSDRARKRCVYFIPVGTLIRLCREIGVDDIVSMQMRRDSNGDMRIVKASRNL
jgi:nucleotide-binding universal stress UspA family protein